MTLFNGMTAFPESDEGFWIFSATRSSYCKFSRDEVASNIIYHYKVTGAGQEQFFVKLAKANSNQPTSILGSGPKPLGSKAQVHNNEMICGTRTSETGQPVLARAVENRLAKVAAHFTAQTFKMSASEKATLRAKY